MLLLVPSFIMVVAWVIFNIYHSSVTSTISENLNTQISPISPTFDMKTVDEIKKRKNINPNYEFQAPKATEVPQPSSRSASPTPNPNLNQQSASSGGSVIP